MTSVLPRPSDHLEMPKRVVGRRLVRTCSFGASWPCEKSAGLRWTSLRDQITRDAATEQELGDGYGDMGTNPSWDCANQHWGRAEALREVLATMERMEADQ